MRHVILIGWKVVDSEVRWIMKANEDVSNNASRMLMQGMETQNQMEVTLAVQVFFSSIHHDIRDLHAR